MTNQHTPAIGEEPFFFPYIFGSERGYKAHVLADTPGEVVVAEPQPPLLLPLMSRRDALRFGVGAAGAAIFVVGRPGKSQAFFWYVAGAVFAGAVGWLVGRVLDRVFPLQVEDLRETKTPTPTKDDYHDQFANPWIVTNQARHVKTARNNTFNVSFGVDEYQRITDQNTIEIGSWRKEAEDPKIRGPLLLPAGLRRPLKDRDKRELRETARLYDVEADSDNFEYVQTFNDDKGQPHVGFVPKRGKGHMLLK